MIGIVLPTRGLVFTEVEEAIEEMRREHNIQVYRSYDLPIPDAQNNLTKKALSEKNEWLFFIEEDTVPPYGALTTLIRMQADIACIDYSVQGWGCVTRDKQTSDILWCGLGCTLIRREVFEKLEEPWFRTDKSLRLNDWQWIDVPAKYGTLDIWFCTKAREAGFRIQQAEGECKHLGLASLGVKEHNHGLHIIQKKLVITKHQVLEKL